MGRRRTRSALQRSKSEDAPSQSPSRHRRSPIPASPISLLYSFLSFPLLSFHLIAVSPVTLLALSIHHPPSLTRVHSLPTL